MATRPDAPRSGGRFATTKVTAAGHMYGAALSVALDPAQDPQAREAASALMRDLADGMRRPELNETQQRRNISFRSLVCASIDQAIYGPDHEIEG